MSFNIKHMPFSRFGSFLSISYLGERSSLPTGIYLRNIRGGDNHDGAVFKIDVLDQGKVVPFDTTLSSTELKLSTDNGHISFIYPETDYVRFRGENIGLRLTLQIGGYDNAFLHDESQWQVNVFSEKIRFMMTSLEGKINVDAPWKVNGCKHVVVDFLPDQDSGTFDGTAEEFFTDYVPKQIKTTFESDHNRIVEVFESWKSNVLPVPETYKKGKDTASYITWSSVVNAEGLLSRKAMYMSKNWMTNIWSWDHCFNAMALAKNNPKLAWDQFMIFFDVQDESGLLPDYMNDQYAYWNCSKPPIHGWTLAWMMERMAEFSEEQLLEIYEPLTKWTNWYLEHRTVHEDTLPVYHHGNDSGWDNSTVFAKGIPIESPDLVAFLVLQMETLAKVAKSLDKIDEQKEWENLSKNMVDKMLDRFWDGERFFARYYGEKVEIGDSLLLFMPIVLGARLPEEIRSKLVEGLKEKGRFLTDHGLATESQKSTYYVDDGYWRGPIWAPSTMLLIDGLVSVGETEFAKELAVKFCKMANENGMAENYDAKTGNGLRDRAFTWTSSVFLILANEYI